MAGAKWLTCRAGDFLLAMNPRTAHIILGLFDVLALLAVCYIYSRWVSIGLSVAEQSESIVVQGALGVYLSGLFVPAVHAYSFLGEKKASVLAKPLLSLVLLTIVVAVFFVSSAIEQKLQSAGYTECSNAQQMTRSEFKTFVLDPSSCH